MSVTLTVNGKKYQRWISVRVKRSLKNVASGFRFDIPGELDPPILPFAPCVIDDDGDKLLTGYIDTVEPDITAHSTHAVITGASKTQDLIDCMLEFPTNQFNGQKLDAIARAVAKPFGIAVVLMAGADVGEPFPDATFEVSEPAFRFLERLARQRGILLTDDENGNLVLATLGTAKAPGSLVQGPDGNVFRARGKLASRQRFSKYTVYSQAGMLQTGSDVLTGVKAVAQDGGVPRYRPWAGIAESSIMEADAKIRAQWEMAHRSGEAVAALLSVPEWRVQGTLWKINQQALCNVPRLTLKQTYLIGSVDLVEDREGRHTELLVAPPSAFAPGHLKEKHSGDPWGGIVPVSKLPGGVPGGAPT